MADKNTFIRILRLWRIHAYLDVMWMARDTRFFLICFVADMLSSFAFLTTTLLVAERFDGIGTWSKPQVIFMLGYGSVVRGLIDIFFGYNICYISRRLGRGQLDHTLIQPQPIWVTLLTEGFSPFQNLCYVLPGLGLVLWSAIELGLLGKGGWLMLFSLSVVGSCLVALSFTFLWGSLAFWFPQAAEEVNSSTNHLMHSLRVFPLDGMGQFLIGGMLTVIPVGLLAWYPCKCLLGLDGISWHAAVTPAAGAAFLMIMAYVFGKGMNYYVRTGSQRYSDFGHRR